MLLSTTIASEVNQLNRIKLMISVAEENYKNGVNGEVQAGKR